MFKRRVRQVWEVIKHKILHSERLSVLDCRRCLLTFAQMLFRTLSCSILHTLHTTQFNTFQWFRWGTLGCRSFFLYKTMLQNQNF